MMCGASRGRFEERFEGQVLCSVFRGSSGLSTRQRGRAGVGGTWSRKRGQTRPVAGTAAPPATQRAERIRRNVTGDPERWPAMEGRGVGAGSPGMDAGCRKPWMVGGNSEEEKGSGVVFRKDSRPLFFPSSPR